MVSSRSLLFGFMFLVCGCATTIVGEDLPLVGPVQRSSKPLKVIVEFADPTLREEQKQFIFNELSKNPALESVRLLEPIKTVHPPIAKAATDYFPNNTPTEDWDIKLRVAFRSRGFYEPYCLLTLAIIPCTPPLNWELGVMAFDRNGKILATKFVKEQATSISWLLGFLFGWKKQSKAESELFQNMLNHVFTRMREDKAI